jgi:hypothetical protein
MAGDSSEVDVVTGSNGGSSSSSDTVQLGSAREREVRGKEGEEEQQDNNDDRKTTTTDEDWKNTSLTKDERLQALRKHVEALVQKRT